MWGGSLLHTCLLALVHKSDFKNTGCFSLAVLSMLSSPLGNVLGKPPLGFLPLDPIGSDISEKFSAPALRNSRLDSRSLLDSRSSSPSDSDTSGFSSGSDHLSDLIVSLGPVSALCSLALWLVASLHASGEYRCAGLQCQWVQLPPAWTPFELHSVPFIALLF